MEQNRHTKTTICRQCGAIIGETHLQCWFCHRTLSPADVITVEKKEVEEETKAQAQPLAHRAQSPAQWPFTASRTASIDLGRVYETGKRITFVVVFVACWMYAVINYGWFLGIGLGWFPALVVAGIGALLWPLIVVVAVVVIAAIKFMTVG